MREGLRWLRVRGCVRLDVNEFGLSDDRLAARSFFKKGGARDSPACHVQLLFISNFSFRYCRAATVQPFQAIRVIREIRGAVVFAVLLNRRTAHRD